MTEGQKDMDTHPSYLTEGQKDRELKQYTRGKYGLKGQNKSAQGNALGIVRNQHSPRMGKRIIISPTPLPFSNGGLSFFCPLRGRIHAASSPPGRCPGLAYQCPIRGVWSLTFRRICYPPESNIRIFNPQYPATQPRLKSADKYK